MSSRLVEVKRKWIGSSLGQESSFHQLAPYIGKLKTSIARSLILEYSKPGDTVLDPFAGSGVVPLEAILTLRNVVANDLNPYAATLTKAKIFPPNSLDTAIKAATEYVRLAKSRALASGYNSRAPLWVRKFFHRRTLAELEALRDILQERSEWFLLACLLGILHHQRPGFLSHPSSHLVPYLRTRKFPRKAFPDLYQYRDVEPRLLNKIDRAFRRLPPTFRPNPCVFTSMDVASLQVCHKVNLLLTSPPYMNALDYGRDNRLRLWFLGADDYRSLDALNCRTPESFGHLITHIARLGEECLTKNGKIVLVVGSVAKRKGYVDTSQIVKRALESAGGFRLVDQVTDLIPDVRRSRRTSRRTKREWIMTFMRVGIK